MCALSLLFASKWKHFSTDIVTANTASSLYFQFVSYKLYAGFFMCHRKLWMCGNVQYIPELGNVIPDGLTCPLIYRLSCPCELSMLFYYSRIVFVTVSIVKYTMSKINIIQFVWCWFFFSDTFWVSWRNSNYM